MGGGSAKVPEPTPEERQSQGLTNQLTQIQIDDALAKRSADAYKQSPQYLNQQLYKDRTTAQDQFNTSKGTAYNTAYQNILNQFKDLGQPDAAAPYLHALQVAASNVNYHPGEDYHYALGAAPAGWDEAGYLAANPDVAAALKAPATNPFGVKDPNAFTSGLDHYNRVGKAEGRKGGVDPNYGRDDPVVGGTTGTYDDPNTLLNNDFGAGTYIDAVRQTRKDQQFNTAKSQIASTLGGMGLSQADMDLLGNAAIGKMDNLYQTSGLSANDYSNVFDPTSVLTSVEDQQRGLRRAQYTTQAKAALNGLDPTKDFADTADDPYINQIVGSQYNDAFNALDRAHKRGALTDTGYNAGLTELGTNRSAAMSTANSLGGAVLTRDQGALSDITKKATTDAGAWDFGQSFDPNSYKTQYDTKKASLQGNLQGDISTALQGQNFFDVGNILNKAGFAQGAQNTAALTTDSNSPDYLAALGTQDKNKTANRGLGGQGVF